MCGGGMFAYSPMGSSLLEVTVCGGMASPMADLEFPVVSILLD